MGSFCVQGLTQAEGVLNPAGRAALEALAGTWSQEEADAFTAAIAPLEQVDPKLWA